jgi:hypothetical protein
MSQAATRRCGIYIKFRILNSLQCRTEETSMEIQRVRDLLQRIALAHTPVKADEALREIAIALLHLAEGIEEIRVAVRRLPPQ